MSNAGTDDSDEEGKPQGDDASRPFVDSGGLSGKELIPKEAVVLTRGGGYTDPSPEGDLGGGATGVGIRVIPGGGFTDPGRDGFKDWGGYVPPLGNEIDPVVDPSPDAYQSEGVSIARRGVNSMDGSVRLETFKARISMGPGSAEMISVGHRDDTKEEKPSWPW